MGAYETRIIRNPRKKVRDTIRKFGVILAAGVLLFGLRADATGWRARNFPGTLCQAATGGALYTQGAIQNPSTSSDIGVSCPVTYDIDSSLGTISSMDIVAGIDYTDANAVSGSQGDLWCQLQVLGDDGTVMTSPARHSCSTAGGCSTSTTGTFSGYLEFSLNSFFQTNPDYVASVNFVCSISYQQSINGLRSILWDYDGIVTYN